MTVDELLSRGVQVLLGEEADKVRSRFINQFVDVESDWYKNRIAKLKRYSDGDFYSGYLWEVVPNYTRISANDAGELSQSLGQSYALWDLHSAEKILLPDYWKFPRDAVLRGRSVDLMDGRSLLPEDLYIVRGDFEVCLVLTHEEAPDGVPIILEVRPLRQR